MGASPFALMHAYGHRLERRFDRARARIKKRLGWVDPVTIQPFRGYGDGDRLRLRGRVLEQAKQTKPRPNAGKLDNLIGMLRRFETDEIAGARVKSSFKGQTGELRSDEEGYIEWACDRLDGSRPDALVWERMLLELIEPYQAGQPSPLVVEAPILVPPADADFAVVSDIDDTIVRTGATNILRNLQTTLLNSVDQRLPFLGLAPFYRALQRGQSASARNPIFYVSSSPWNLYGFLEEFMRLNHIPLGPMFLKDFGWDDTKFIKTGHGDHKIEAIETLLAFYPDLRFILIGDSGQHDVEIYKTIAVRHPGRVLAVYIRALHEAPGRDPQAQELLGDIEKTGVQVALCPDLLLAAERAESRGWIASSAIDEIHSLIEQSRKAS